MTKNETLQRFGHRLRALRSERGLSQEGLADICGLDRTYVGGIERGERNVTLLTISQLAQGLGISISKLMEAV